MSPKAVREATDRAVRIAPIQQAGSHALWCCRWCNSPNTTNRDDIRHESDCATVFASAGLVAPSECDQLRAQLAAKDALLVEAREALEPFCGIRVAWPDDFHRAAELLAKLREGS